MFDPEVLVRDTSSSLLFHGPQAELQAKDTAALYGRVLLDSSSAKGLRKADSQSAIAIHLNPPASDRMGSIVLGPMDLATKEASDSLLKMVEEPNKRARPFLWAFDVGSVSPTIRSRCLRVWSPDPNTDEKGQVPGVLKDAVRGNPVAVFQLLAEGDAPGLATRIVNYLAYGPSTEVEMALYERLRPTLGKETKTTLAAALLGGRR